MLHNLCQIHLRNMCKVARRSEVERRGDRQFCPSWDSQHIRTGPGSRNISR